MDGECKGLLMLIPLPESDTRQRLTTFISEVCAHESPVFETLMKSLHVYLRNIESGNTFFSSHVFPLIERLNLGTRVRIGPLETVLKDKLTGRLFLKDGMLVYEKEKVVIQYNPMSA